MSVHDCGLIDDETVAMFGNITAALDHSLMITVCTRTFATMNLHPSFLLARRANVAEEDVQLLTDTPKCKECT